MRNIVGHDIVLEDDEFVRLRWDKGDRGLWIETREGTPFEDSYVTEEVFVSEDKLIDFSNALGHIVTELKDRRNSKL